jgi:hypothetical protein
LTFNSPLKVAFETFVKSFSFYSSPSSHTLALNPRNESLMVHQYCHYSQYY